MFNDPSELMGFFERYRIYVKSNPRIKVEYVGKDATRVETPLETPLTVDGFKIFCWEEYGDIANYLKGEYPEFMPIVTHIKEQIRNDQISGGMVGQYNQSLTARLNNLTEKTETTINTPFVLELTATKQD